MTATQVLVFLACVALAAVAQSVTGFAFGLILVGLNSVLQLFPVTDAANVGMVLGLISIGTALRGRRGALDWTILRPTCVGGVFGTVAGVALLAWLSASVVVALQLLLGIAIVGCAGLMFLRVTRLKQTSSNASFAFYGTISGLLGGLFVASGPPLAFQFYRQPIAVEAMRETLIVAMGLTALLRLALVLTSGQFSLAALLLCMLGAPVAIGVSAWIRSHPPGWQPETVVRTVCALLVLAGISLILPAVQNLVAGHSA